MAKLITQTRNNLAPYLASVRARKKLTLREVEEATGKEVSNAYLSQLENGKIAKPSPHVLHALAEVYGEPYELLMEKAGYIGRRGQSPRSPDEYHGAVPTYAVENLTEDEERALLTFLALYRKTKDEKGR
jgi:transcriptional regulator with XRE-family HTH domain